MGRSLHLETGGEGGDARARGNDAVSCAPGIARQWRGAALALCAEAEADLLRGRTQQDRIQKATAAYRGPSCAPGSLLRCSSRQRLGIQPASRHALIRRQATQEPVSAEWRKGRVNATVQRFAARLAACGWPSPQRSRRRSRAHHSAPKFRRLLQSPMHAGTREPVASTAYSITLSQHGVTQVGCGRGSGSVDDRGTTSKRAGRINPHPLPLACRHRTLVAGCTM